MRKPVYLGKTEPGALADRFRREERIEDLVEHIRRNAAAGILHGDGDVLAAISCLTRSQILRRDRDGAAFGHGVAGVDDEIDQRGLELGDVHDDGADVPIDLEFQPDGAADAGVEHIADGVDLLGEIDDLRVDALAPGKGQQLAGERRAAL